MQRLVLFALLVACGGASRGAPATEIVVVPPPAALDRVAKTFGLSVRGDWTWIQSDPQRSRFDWVGHPKSGKYDVLYSFWIPKLDESETKLLPGLVETAAANLTTASRVKRSSSHATSRKSSAWIASSRCASSPRRS